ncbi:MAG: hypothetical protein IJ733_03190, partial [Lachnospiraceae bacterium]|nr:hypothetical protein [Lachnospiraceae bacterium]
GLYENEEKSKEFDNGEELKSYASVWKKQRTLLGFFCLYAAILLLAWLSGTLFLNSGDTMGYTLLYYYFLLPVISGISSAVYVYYAGPFGLLAGAVMGYLNPFTAAVVFHYENPWSVPFEKGSFLFYLPVLLGIGVGILLWVIKKLSAYFQSKPSCQPSGTTIK